MNTRYEQIDYYSDTNRLSTGTMIFWHIASGQVFGVTVCKRKPGKKYRR